MTNILDQFGGSSYPAVKWADVGVGNSVVGIIVDIANEPVQNKLNPDTQSIPITLELESGDIVTLWPGTKSQLGSAIKTAVLDAKAQTLQRGAKLGVKYVKDEPPKQAGHSPMRVFAAQYSPPADSGVEVEDIF
jgi:hypothetical protein